jgi:transposase
VHGQRTHRLTAVLRALAFELSAEAGARVTQHLQMAVSGDTLLRVIRHTPEQPLSPPRVLGIDDWAFKKGERYGTILVDLERHLPVDLLPDREAQTLAAWLKVRPGIEIISRDRAGAYAEGARVGAPQAVQVADRWHLLKNLGDALATTYACHQSLLRQIRVAGGQSFTVDKRDPAPAQPSKKADRSRQRLPTARQHARAQRRAYWLGKFQEVHALRDQGLSKHAIARQTGLNIHTVRKYCRLPELPERKVSVKPRLRQVDRYRDYLRQRLQAENPSSRQLWREIQAQGFSGGHTMVYHCVAQLRQELNLLPPRRRQAVPVAPPSKALTARTLVALVLSQPETLSDDKQQLIAQACQLHPEIQHTTQLAREFAAILRARDAERLDEWLQAACTSDIPTLVGFASGLQNDYAAVKAAFCLPWSNGQVEGQVNRLKCIKRQLYGRAKFDLLRLRVLHPP